MTKYPEVLNLRDKSAHSVIQVMKATFARYGIPKEIVSDYVPFASQEMRKLVICGELSLCFPVQDIHNQMDLLSEQYKL